MPLKYCFKGPYISRLTQGAGQALLEVTSKMKIVCEVCGNKGYLQHIGKNYYRIRHYAGLDSVSKKPRFEYHRQSLSYVQSLLRQNNPSPIDLIDPKTIDPIKPNTSSISSSKWTGGDLNPRPPECKSGVHTN